MRRTTPVVAVLAALTLGTGVAAGQPHQDPTTPRAKLNHIANTEARYIALHDRAGDCAPAEHRVWKRGAGPRELWRTMKRVRLCLNPPPPEPFVQSEPAEPVVSEPSYAVSGGGCPSYMAGEASSPDAVNPASGATGCFQVIPSTAAAHGCDLSTMVGQYECAGRICATSGDGAWVAADPCSYLGTEP